MLYFCLIMEKVGTFIFFKVIFYYAVDSTEIIVPFNSGFPDPIVVLNVATVSKSNVTQWPTCLIPEENTSAELLICLNVDESLKRKLFSSNL